MIIGISIICLVFIGMPSAFNLARNSLLGWLPLMCNNHWQLQQLQLELHLPCAPIQDVKGWQPPILTTKQEQLPWNAYK
jgi:hypothetical protein